MPAESPTVVGLGEVLFDCFPDRTVLGGAPINAVVHADALLAPGGGRAVPATRIGRDDLGDRFLRELEERGISAEAVQTDADLPTGRVEVSIDARGEASYRFAANTAWDNLAFSAEWRALAAAADGVVFGTLAQRSEVSRRAVQEFVRTATGAIRLVDINLREPHFSKAVLRESLTLATAAKMSREELETAVSMLTLSASGISEAELAASVLKRYQLDWLAVTRGADGTALYTPGECFTATPHGSTSHGAEPARTADGEAGDTVGAGDACTAALIVGALLGWPPEQMVEAADLLGGFVAQAAGATPQLPAELLEQLPGLAPA
ncbi:MAG: PfkB family carbohydrate kinase [Planctomycetota bacterium]